MRHNHRLFQLVVLAASTQAAVAGEGILQITEGIGAARWGSSVSAVGDVDGDGFADIIVGAPGDESSSVVSVKLGATLFTVFGVAPNDAFGSAVCGAGDVDRDGVVDFAVGAPLADEGALDGGTVYVYSGKDASLLYTLSHPEPGARFGAAVANAGDVNRDGSEDVIVGAPEDSANGQARRGYAAVYSGSDHSLLFSTGGLFRTDDNAGYAVATAGDFDGDGYPDVLVGVPGDDTRQPNAGSASIISGRTGGFLHVIYGNSINDRLGTSVSTAGDVNGDGFDDVAAGSPFDNQEFTIEKTGSVEIFLGPTKQLYLTWNGLLWKERFGTGVTSLGDVDGDGVPDLAASAVPFASAREGAVRILSVKTARELESFHGQPGALEFGVALAALPDLSGDGVPDLAVGEPDGGGPATPTGRVTVFAPVGEPRLLRVNSGLANFGGNVAGMGDVDGDSIPDFAASGGAQPKVTIASGLDGHTILTLTGNPTSAFGASLAGADLSGDGIPDVIVGDPAQSYDEPRTGAVQAFSGADGSLLWQAIITKSTGLGSDLDVAGDVNRDGFPDVIAGEPYFEDIFFDPGRAHVYSGHDGSELLTFTGTDATFGLFGYSVSGAGDVDHDGAADVIVGARYDDSVAPDGGLALVYSGASGATLYTFAGSSDQQLGGNVAGGQDLDGDGTPDLLVTRLKAVLIFSGRDGSPRPEIETDLHGLAVTDLDFAGDLDRDGYADIVASGWSHDQSYAGEGLVMVWSGKKGAPLAIWRSTDHLASVFFAVSDFGDQNHDGAPDILVGDPWHKTVGVYTIPQRWADFGNYGSGWPGTLGIPELTLSANPFLCATSELHVESSRGTTTGGWLVVGLARATLPTSFGATLFVLPTIVRPITVPGAGLVVPFEAPCSDAIAGLPIYLQVIEQDPGASHGVSFTPALEMVFSN